MQLYILKSVSSVMHISSGFYHVQETKKLGVGECDARILLLAVSRSTFCRRPANSTYFSHRIGVECYATIFGVGVCVLTFVQVLLKQLN